MGDVRFEPKNLTSHISNPAYAKAPHGYIAAVDRYRGIFYRGAV